MSIKIQITFTDAKTMRTWTVMGQEIKYDSLRGFDLTTRINETQEYLRRLTGLEVRIETARE